MLSIQLFRASRIHRPIFEQSRLDQNAFRKEITSDLVAESAQVLAAASTDRDLREIFDALRSFESGIEDLLKTY